MFFAGADFVRASRQRYGIGKGEAAAKWYLMSYEAWVKQQSWFYAFDGELIENTVS